MYRSILHLILAMVLLPGVTLVHAAKPASRDVTTSAEPPEIHRSTVDYAQRTLTLQGINLVTGSAGSPEYPLGVTIGGAVVAIDETASLEATDFSSNRGLLIIPFDNILAALAGLSADGALPAKINFAIKATTTSGSATSSSYFAQAVVEVSSPPPPPSSGSCPCSPEYDQYYNALYALLWPTCTAPGSSNATAIAPTEQYIEASYIDELMVRYVTISSDSSISSRNSGSSNHVSSCSVRTDGGVFLSGPIPVSDADHAVCVADIIDREPICRGGNWLDP